MTAMTETERLAELAYECLRATDDHVLEMSKVVHGLLDGTGEGSHEPGPAFLAMEQSRRHLKTACALSTGVDSELLYAAHEYLIELSEPWPFYRVDHPDEVERSKARLQRHRDVREHLAALVKYTRLGFDFAPKSVM